ncbi:winged helix-turn-helix transcriptional regulator [Nocardia uniformis]|uniref:Winged helix-turn-helix transcriptional regulator n=1 Tax=Nocardia uniformis TaxID=53432 RepID=A0A849BYT7_9NOCA|nr:MarR family winged helix-turn-helix transcriptional regulator [Nocardia uniformis]NNH69420.1 winged helix-turn-helix transcriptional regulator [Nocardia uniformis]
MTSEPGSGTVTETPEVRWLDDVEGRAWLGYVFTRDLVAAAVGRDSLRESDLTYVEYTVLARLADAPDHRRSFAELAAVLEWSQSRLSHQITRMEKRGLVARESIPDDARRTAAVLSEKGARVLESAAPAHVNSVRRHMIDVLDRSQLAALADIYDTLLEHHRRPSAQQQQRNRHPA